MARADILAPLWLALLERLSGVSRRETQSLPDLVPRGSSPNGRAGEAAGDVVQLVQRCPDRRQRIEGDVGRRIVLMGLRQCRGPSALDLSLDELAEVRGDGEPANQGGMAKRLPRVLVNGDSGDLVLTRHGVTVLHVALKCNCVRRYGGWR